MAKIFGQLEKAQLENTTSDTGSLPKGMATYRTDQNVAKVSNGTVMKELVDTDTTQTLSGKTLTAPTSNNGTFNTPTINNPTIADYADLEEQASVGTNPSAGFRRFFVKSDGNAYLRDSSGNETLLGSGGGGGINYIDNGKAEVNTTGWATYLDDTSLSYPVDGTAGSATVTFTRSTSSPLRDIASFLLTKDANNRRGEGASYDFSIDDADKAKVLRITADYAVSSGTFSYGDGTVASPSDVRVFIYDVTNAVLIEPTQTLLDGSGRIVTEFQSASDSNSYRLIFHVATVSASAWVLKLDAIEVGPRELARGPIITDWTAFTPSDTSITQFPTSSRSFQYRRVGNAADVRFALTASGAITGTDFAPEEWLPPGLVANFDTAAGTLSGTARMTDASAASGANEFGGTVFAISSSGTLRVISDRGDSVDGTDPFTWASGDTLEVVVFGVPIVSWQSNTVTSSDSGTRLLAAMIGLSGDQVVSSTAVTTITFDTVRFDKGGLFSAANNGFKVTESGVYDANIQAYITGMTALDNTSINIQKNGSTVFGGTLFYPLASTIGTFQRIVPIECVAGDIITVNVDSSADSSFTIDSTSGRTSFSLAKRQSPQTIGMADRVACKYTTSAGSSIAASTATFVDFGTKVYDTHGMVVGAGGGNVTTALTGFRAVVPMAGLYQCNITYHFAAASFPIGDRMEIDIRKNNTVQRYSTKHGNGHTSQFLGDMVVSAFECVAGDVIQGALFQNAGSRSLINDGRYVQFELVRIG